MKKSMQRKMKARIALQSSQSAMNDTFSMRQRWTRLPLFPLVPQETLSTLEKAQINMTCEQAPWQTMQLIASKNSLKTKVVWVGRCTRAMTRQLPTLMHVMTKTRAFYVDAKISPMPLRVSISRQTPNTLQMTSPMSKKVQKEKMQDMQCALLVHSVPKRLQVTLRMIMKMQIRVSTSAAYWMTQLDPDCTIVVQRAKRQKAGMRQPLTNESRARNIEIERRMYLRMKLWLDYMALQQQFLKTQRKAKQLELIHRRRWIINCS